MFISRVNVVYGFLIIKYEYLDYRYLDLMRGEGDYGSENFFLDCSGL